MKLCRFRRIGGLAAANAERLGVVRGVHVHDVSAICRELPTIRWPVPAGDALIAGLDRLRPGIEALADKEPGIPVSEVRLVAPVANPSKVICGVANFVDHGFPDPRVLGLLFKTVNALAGPSEGVVLHWRDRIVYHEVELVVVIGRGGSKIAAADALGHVAGYAVGLDMTLQGKEQTSYCKSADGFGVFGPWMVTADEIPDPRALHLRFWLNGELRQDESLARQVLSVADLIEFSSRTITLCPGDLIFCGTPKGLGPVSPGDLMVAEIGGIGRMEVQVHL